MNELSLILDEMAAAGNALAKAAAALKAHYSSTAGNPPEDRPAGHEEPSPAAAPAGQDDNPAQKTYSYEEVRQICAAKTAADNGAYKREVLDIIKKYADGKTLSKVDPSLYAGLVAEVEAIGNAR